MLQTFRFVVTSFCILQKNQEITLKVGGEENRKIVSMNLMANDVVIFHILSQLDALNSSGFFSLMNEEPNPDLYDMAVILDDVINCFL